MNESVEDVKPDAIVGCESWLGAEHKDAEIFPDEYKSNIFRKDRNKNGGGVLVFNFFFSQTNINLTFSERTEIKMVVESWCLFFYFFFFFFFFVLLAPYVCFHIFN